MMSLTENEAKAMLMIFKDFNTLYNANSLSKKINLTSMGTLKILKKFEKKELLVSKKLGKAIFYKPNLKKDFTKSFLDFLLEDEAENTLPRIKRWSKEFSKLKDNAKIGILFGSLLNTGNYNDVDLLLVMDKGQNEKINKLIHDISQLSLKKVHLVKQTKDDLESNMRKKDEAVLNIIKTGIVLFGYEEFTEVLLNVNE